MFLYYFKNLILFIILSTSLILLAGCSLFFPVKNTPANHYLLSAAPPIAPTKIPHHALTLLVMPMQTAPAYDTTAMAYTTEPYQLAYFSKNSWAEMPAQMLQALMIQTLQNTHCFHAIITGPSATRYDRVLHTQLLQLQQEFLQHPSQVRLTIRAQLINALTNQVIATREFSIIEPALQDNPYSGVIAANRATAKFLQQLAKFSCMYN